MKEKVSSKPISVKPSMWKLIGRITKGDNRSAWMVSKIEKAIQEETELELSKEFAGATLEQVTDEAYSIYKGISAIQSGEKAIKLNGNDIVLNIAFNPENKTLYYNFKGEG